MNLGGHDIGITSWSQRSNSIDSVIETLRQVGLSHVQLSFIPLISDTAASAAAFERLTAESFSVTAGMVGFIGENYSTISTIRITGGLVPEDAWSDRRETTLAAGRIASEQQVPRVTLHIGFVPPSNDPAYKRLLDRMADLAGEYAKLNVDLLLETGQEKAPDLLRFLNDLNAKNVGVNFDPANMLLYGSGDPIEAVRTLGRHIRHVHLKDALMSERPGVEWGKEVVFGSGDLKAVDFFRSLEDIGYAGPYIIERESGRDYVSDLQETVARLQEILE